MRQVQFVNNLVTRVENETETDGTCFIVFVFFYLFGIENGIENSGNEYENGNHRI
jgi:hypothetical protein